MSNKMVSVSIAVDRALDMFGVDMSKHDSKFTYWAIEAENKIGSYYQYERNIHVLKVEGNCVPLPACVYSAIGVLAGDNSECCGTDFEKINRDNRMSCGHASVFNVLADPSDNSKNFQASEVRWEVQGHKIVLANHEQIDKITVQTLDYITDVNGIPKVNSNHIHAIASYIELAQAKTTRWSKGGDIKITETAIDQMNREWHRLVLHARVEDAKPTATEFSDMVSMINDPLTGHGVIFPNSFEDNYYGY